MSDASGTVVPLRGGQEHGAEAFRVLCRTIGEIADATGDVADTDYRAIVEVLRASLDANLHGQPAEHATGFLRALADLLCIFIDGCAVDPRQAEWDPIKATRRSFTV